jgi:hypothetical protein
MAATAAFLMTAALAGAQDSPPAPPPPQKPALASHKVWTNDDIVSLRSPAANYLAQKEAEAAAEALAKLRTSTVPSQPSQEIKQPISLKDAERAITDLLEDIQDQQATLDRLSKERDESPEDQKRAKMREIERRTAVLQESQKELKALQDTRDDLASRAAQSAIPPSGGSR